MNRLIGKPRELATYLFTLDQDKDFEIKQVRKSRSLNANAYFHSLVNQLAKYNNISNEEMKIQMNLSYGTLARNDDGTIAGVKVPKGTNIQKFYNYAKWYKSDGNYDCYLFYERTSNLSSKDFADLIKGVEQECKQVGIATLDDLEFEAMMKDYEKSLNHE